MGYSKEFILYCTPFIKIEDRKLFKKKKQKKTHTALIRKEEYNGDKEVFANINSCIMFSFLCLLGEFFRDAF